MDRTSDDPPIAWQVSVKHDLPGGKRRGFMERFAQAVDQRAREAAWPELGDLGDRPGFVWSEMNHVSPVDFESLD